MIVLFELIKMVDQEIKVTLIRMVKIKRSMILRVLEPSVLEGDNQVTVRQVIQNFRRGQS